MNNKQKYKILLNISIGSAILFLVLSFLSMFFYSGGSMINNPKNPLYSESNLSYSHIYNFFSDLGLYTSWSGYSNSISLVLFSYSLLFVAIELVAFYYAIHYILRKDKRLINISRLGFYVALISAICFVMVGLFPSDTMFSYHIFAVNLAFRSFLLVMFIYSYAIFKSSYISNYLALSYFSLFCLVGYYVYILLFGPALPAIPYSDPNFYNQLPSLENLSFHVVSQKFVVYGVIFSTLWQLVELGKQKYIDLID
tara:strand:- start:1885 stop:2646 length:762 start_codon:yes stop_codon:yes gene_type:complete